MLTLNYRILTVFLLVAAAVLVGCNTPELATQTFATAELLSTETSIVETEGQQEPNSTPLTDAQPTTVVESTVMPTVAAFATVEVVPTVNEVAEVEPAQPSALRNGCSTGVQYEALPFNDLDLWSVYQSGVDADYSGIIAFWQATYPQQFGTAFPGVCHTVEYTPETVPFQESCVTPDRAANNAFYCPSVNAVMWDGPTFYHQIYSDLGPASLTFITAHEFGHAVQFLSGTLPATSVNTELQADCYAGAYLGYAANQGLLTQEDARDVILIVAAVGQSRFGSTWLTRSHGTSLQRELATQRGFTDGVAGCQIDFSEPIRPLEERNGPLRQ